MNPAARAGSHEGRVRLPDPMDNLPNKMTLDAEWTDDCQGKKDYDAPIIEISTRYWPRGGGFMLVRREEGQPVKIEENEARPEVKPSANSTLIIRHSEGMGIAELAEQNFEADTYEEVAAQVETWAQQQMDRVVAALRREYAR